MSKDKDHLIKQKCRENIIGFAPFRYRFGKGSSVKEGLLNIAKLDEGGGGHLVLTFIFDSNDFNTDSDIQDRMSHLDFKPLTKNGLLTALRNSAEFEQNENFAMHEFNFYFENMPSNIPKLITKTFVPFFLDRLYMRIGEIEWMPQGETHKSFFGKLKDKLI